MSFRIRIYSVLLFFSANISLQTVLAQTPGSSFNKHEKGLFCDKGFYYNKQTFPIHLLKELSSNNENLFFSPYSISTALSMAYEGAGGQTASEMEKVLCLEKDSTQRHSRTSALYDEINNKNKLYTLSTANALWAANNFDFNPLFKNTITNTYKGGLSKLDFVHQAEASRTTINTWVEKQTNDRIKNLIPSGLLTPYTRLVLTNAIYFKGTWLKQFNKDDTQESSFYSSSGKIQAVKMMQKTDDKAVFNYFVNEQAQVIELPYTGNELSMYVVLPSMIQRENFNEIAFIENFQSIEQQLKMQRVDLYLPKFKFDTKYLLSGALVKMGMPTAFDDGADFSGMSTGESLKISQVVHQAFVEVNEEGTEAAAATAVVMVVTDNVSPSKPVIPVFRADRPFFFMIKHKSTGQILFMGKMNKVD